MQNFIIGNEPNVNRFWQPQYVTERTRPPPTTSTRLRSPTTRSRPCGRTRSCGARRSLARQRPGGGCIEPQPLARVVHQVHGRRIQGVGPDEADLRRVQLPLYPPVQDTEAFSKRFPWPQAGAADLDRIKQALWDAFNGTNQPTVTEQPEGATASRDVPQSLPIDLDEAESKPSSRATSRAYDGTAENVVPITEAAQSVNHVELAEIGAAIRGEDGAAVSTHRRPRDVDRVPVRQPLRRLHPEALLRGHEGEDRLRAGHLPGRRLRRATEVVAHDRGDRRAGRSSAGRARIRARSRSTSRLGTRGGLDEPDRERGRQPTPLDCSGSWPGRARARRPSLSLTGIAKASRPPWASNFRLPAAHRAGGGGYRFGTVLQGGDDPLRTTKPDVEVRSPGRDSGRPRRQVAAAPGARRATAPSQERERQCGRRSVGLALRPVST